jgi:chromosome segregation protein
MASVRLALLTVEGFKSFAATAELSFPGALIAIVGPNGVGKSNIADAITWVLGEQSARLLRSQLMGDVIFAGAPGRAALNAAQVSLTLASADGRWQESEGRLTVSRRVLRDGTSDYRLQGRRVRLKDVLDELMDAGLGTRAYAIIEQGRIGQVLSVKATERRALFEEAAGITKYRARRHEAELKLAETNANLLRVADVAAEVKRALDAARRQARRAQRHLELRHELLTIRAALFAGRRGAALAAVAARQQALTEAAAAEAQAAAGQASADAAFESVRRELDASQERLADVRAMQAQADAMAQRREAEEEAARREATEAISRRDAATAEAARLAAVGATHAEMGAPLAQAVEVAEAVFQEQERAALAAAEQTSATESATRAAVAAAEDARRALLMAVAAATDARNGVHRLEIELEQAGYQQTRLAAEHERLHAHLAATAASEQAAASEEAAAAQSAGRAAAERQALRSHHESLTVRAAELAAARDRSAHERWQAHHEREGLLRALANARALPQALARVLPSTAVLGTVADFLAPPPEVARLLDRAYGDLLNLPVVAGEDAAAALIAGNVGSSEKLEVIVADESVAPRPSPLLERSGAAPAHLGWLTHALQRVVTADDAGHAHRLAAMDPDSIILLPDGGRRRGAHLELPGRQVSAPGVLELRLREGEVAAAEREAAAREQQASGALAAVQDELTALAPALAQHNGEAQRATEVLAAAVSAHQTFTRERERLERELDALASEQVRLAEEHTGLAVRLATGRAEADRLAVRASDLEGQVDALAREAERARDAAATVRADTERLRGAAALGQERVAAARRELARHHEELTDLRAREHQARADAQAQSERATAATHAVAQARADLEELLARRTVAAREAEQLAVLVEELRGRSSAAEAAATDARAAYLQARDATHTARLTLTEAQGMRERLDETIALTLAGHAELPEIPPDPEQVPGLEEREQTVAKDLEALGPVNELAVAERDELETRHHFLTEQRRDLERSLASLADTVKELDATCAERFLATLAEANTAFDDVFKRLFGGGEAKAELSDPEAPLESGIELRVRPPGKHTQSVLLLSGGEKALAAVALLLALFRIRPAPFCLLDEVDAPLDDANVERFCGLLREMSGDTQFLLITHNRRTMAHADVLYGVSMEEPGVSRIVSVRLEE